jgi:hypothetical protein
LKSQNDIDVLQDIFKSGMNLESQVSVLFEVAKNEARG